MLRASGEVKLCFISRGPEKLYLMIQREWSIEEVERTEAMAESEVLRRDKKSEGSATHQVLRWARCHPGTVFFGSLALAALFASGSQAEEQTTPPRVPETEADLVDGDTPLFI